MDDGTSIAPDGDLWAFIGDELKMGIPENDRIREQKQKYLRNKSYLHDVTLRAEPYMYWIAGQVKKRNMPMELVLLPIVESALILTQRLAPMPQASGRSFRARGAIMV